MFVSPAHPFLRTLANATPLVPFLCNVCGFPTAARRWKFDRESGNCLRCGSSVRHRAVIGALSERLFGKALPIPLFPRRPDLRGVGLSDWAGYGAKLSRRLGYRNTYLHQEPRLDICNPPDELAGSLDFILSSDVFEHVAPPAQRAFDGCFRLLRPGGVLVFTVPYETRGATQEHYPDLHEFSVVDKAGGPKLVNRTREGKEQTFDNLRFHGGDGATLEMRVFALASLREHLARAGFVDGTVHAQSLGRYGIWHESDKSLPLSARKE